MPGYYPSQAPLGRLCNAGCGTKVPRALNEAGIERHPTCGPEADTLLAADRAERTSRKSEDTLTI